MLESAALTSVIRELRNMGFRDCNVEGDSVVVIHWGIGKGVGVWKLAHIIYEIRDWAIELGISFAHVQREQNALADKMANWAVWQSIMFVDSVIPDL